MEAKVTTRPVGQVIAAIEALDLESVKLRATDPELGEGWTREYADSIERAYRNYLIMLVKYPEHAEEIMVSEDVDEFWHIHILHTMKYTEDCNQVFGAYLHHTPQTRESAPATLERRAASAEKTRHLYQREFGELQNVTAARSKGASAWCGAAVEREGAAWCGAAIEAKLAAWCGAAVEGKAAAWCGAAIKREGAAWCGAAVVAKEAAWCGAAVKREGAAWCGAAVVAKEAAWCGAAVKREGAAWCGAAIAAKPAAWCGAAVEDKDAAWCGAAVKREGAAWCGAAKPLSKVPAGSLHSTTTANV
jgi:hypothetical protein